MSREEPVCPNCGQPLRYRDRKPRIWKWYGAEKRTIQVRRLRCIHCNCLHTELPDVLAPHRHYGSEVIENVIDGVSTPEDLSTEDYPCEKTMQRWQDWFVFNRDQIEGSLRSAGTRLLGLHESLLRSTDSLLTKLRDLGQGWLSILCRIIYCSGGSLLREKPHEAPAPDLSRGPCHHDVASSCKEVLCHERKRKGNMAGCGGAETLSDDLAASGGGTGSG